MEKNKENKGKMKLNDELLDQVSGGGSAPYTLGDGGNAGKEILQCSNCGFYFDSDLTGYKAGDWCVVCHEGWLS